MFGEVLEVLEVLGLDGFSGFRFFDSDLLLRGIVKQMMEGFGLVALS